MLTIRNILLDFQGLKMEARFIYATGVPKILKDHRIYVDICESMPWIDHLNVNFAPVLFH